MRTSAARLVALHPGDIIITLLIPVARLGWPALPRFDSNQRDAPGSRDDTDSIFSHLTISTSHPLHGLLIRTYSMSSRSR